MQFGGMLPSYMPCPQVPSPSCALRQSQAEKIHLNRVLQPQYQYLIQSEIRSCYSHLFVYFLSQLK